MSVYLSVSDLSILPLQYQLMTHNRQRKLIPIINVVQIYMYTSLHTTLTCILNNHIRSSENWPMVQKASKNATNVKSMGQREKVFPKVTQDREFWKTNLKHRVLSCRCSIYKLSCSVTQKINLQAKTMQCFFIIQKFL